MLAKKLIDCICKLNGVEAVAIGGSRASGNNDVKSDYDIYVYFSDLPSEEDRDKLYSEYCKTYEVGNHYFEYEDNCILNDDTPIDVIFRPINHFVNNDRTKSFLLSAKNGYSTCFLHNIITCNVIFDKTGDFTKFQQELNIDYPEDLRKNIIDRNLKMLHGVLPSYDDQIKKAVSRNDLVSINHRTSAFIESYFDIIFALNKMTHPGEKKLINICKEQCKILPNNFEENLTKLFSSMYSGYDLETLADIVYEITKTVKENI